MTKFPTGKSSKDAQLHNVINEVTKGVEKIDNDKFSARIASDASYSETVWGNVEVHLLGCSRGIAIVEDRYRPELNPNVAMEWGWMRAMGKKVRMGEAREEYFRYRQALVDQYVGKGSSKWGCVYRSVSY